MSIRGSRSVFYQIITSRFSNCSNRLSPEWVHIDHCLISLSFWNFFKMLSVQNFFQTYIDRHLYRFWSIDLIFRFIMLIHEYMFSYFLYTNKVQNYTNFRLRASSFIYSKHESNARKFDAKYYKVEQFVAQNFYVEKKIMTEFCSLKNSESIKPFKC